MEQQSNAVKQPFVSGSRSPGVRGQQADATEHLLGRLPLLGADLGVVTRFVFASAEEQRSAG